MTGSLASRFPSLPLGFALKGALPGGASRPCKAPRCSFESAEPRAVLILTQACLLHLLPTSEFCGLGCRSAQQDDGPEPSGASA